MFFSVSKTNIRSTIMVALAALAWTLTFPAISASFSAEDQYLEAVPAPGRERPTKEVVEEVAASEGFGEAPDDVTAIGSAATKEVKEVKKESRGDRRKVKSGSARMGGYKRIGRSALSPSSAAGIGLALPAAMSLILLIGLGGVLARRYTQGS